MENSEKTIVSLQIKQYLISEEARTNFLCELLVTLYNFCQTNISTCWQKSSWLSTQAIFMYKNSRGLVAVLMTVIAGFGSA